MEETMMPIMTGLSAMAAADRFMPRAV